MLFFPPTSRSPRQRRWRPLPVPDPGSSSSFQRRGCSSASAAFSRSLPRDRRGSVDVDVVKTGLYGHPDQALDGADLLAISRVALSGEVGAAGINGVLLPSLWVHDVQKIFHCPDHVAQPTLLARH